MNDEGVPNIQGELAKADARIEAAKPSRTQLEFSTPMLDIVDLAVHYEPDDWRYAAYMVGSNDIDRACEAMAVLSEKFRPARGSLPERTANDE